MSMKIVNVDQMENGIIVNFADGVCAFFDSDFLYAQVNKRVATDSGEPDPLHLAQGSNETAMYHRHPEYGSILAVVCAAAAAPFLRGSGFFQQASRALPKLMYPDRLYLSGLSRNGRALTAGINACAPP